MPCVPTASTSSRTRRSCRRSANASKPRSPARRRLIHLQPNPVSTDAGPVTTGHYADLANGIRLHYASSGVRGRPLVLCIHGFPEYWGAWEDVLPLLGKWAYAVAPDLRGYNLSSQPTGVEAYRAREIVGDLIGLISALGYAHAVIVAHDWGGAAGWQLAISKPQLVHR